MTKFKSRYPNVTYAGCMFNSKCEFIANDNQAETLRGLKDLILTHDIEEVVEKPMPVELTDEEQKRFDELVKKGKHTTPQEKAELKILKDKKEGK